MATTSVAADLKEDAGVRPMTVVEEVHEVASEVVVEGLVPAPKRRPFDMEALLESHEAEKPRTVTETAPEAGELPARTELSKTELYVRPFARVPNQPTKLDWLPATDITAERAREPAALERTFPSRAEEDTQFETGAAEPAAIRAQAEIAFRGETLEPRTVTETAPVRGTLVTTTELGEGASIERARDSVAMRESLLKAVVAEMPPNKVVSICNLPTTAD